MLSACSIVARNYLAHGLVLAKSFFAHHPGGTFTLLLIDDERRELATGAEAVRCVRLSDIGLDPPEIGRLAAIYDVTELATAVKPAFLRHLLTNGAADVIYLDPDIKLYGSLEDASHLARQHGIVLTPHTTSPMPRDGRRVDDFHILAAGIYNLGFIAVGAKANGFIDWWWERTRREARVDPSRMMFTDQRWVDFVPAFYDHFILRDPTYNVAYWNLHERDLQWTGDRYLVNGKPLTFFHFSGFDAKAPHLLSKHQGERPRILLSERTAVARICREYLADLEESGVAERSALPYGWHTLPSGLPFDRHMRRLYREGLKAFEAGRCPEPPNPFEAGSEDRFLSWLNGPASVGLRPMVSRYLYSIHQDRADLQRAFPDVADVDRQRYFEWIRDEGAAQLDIPTALLPKDDMAQDGRSTYVPADQLTDGVNVAGYFRAEVGVGEAARLLTSAIEAAQIPHSTVTYDATPSRKAHPFLERGDRSAPHNVNILCVNADQTARFAREAGPRFFEGRHTIGYWFWELERFPASMHAAFDYVDEVWTATRFVASGIRAIGRRPVHTIPLPVSVPRVSPDIDRRSLRLPDGFLFLFVFDFFSVLERKNPIGLIQAFARAFRPNEGPVLVIKTINGDQRLTDLERVRAAAGQRPDIFIIDEYYSAEEKNSLLGLCDCYVSLHRSEGLGLVMAEAMSLGKPVIATGYSGNLDFMTADNSYLVDYTQGAVPAGCDPYPRGTPWAEPDIDHAAEIMRRVSEAREEALRKADQARTDILMKHNAQAAAARLSERLDEIRQARAGGALVQPRPFLPADAGVPGDQIATRSIGASLDHASTLLTPTPTVAQGRPLRRPLIFLQELLFRLLRPYWRPQRQAQRLVIDVVRDLARDTERAAKVDPHHRQALEAVWAAVHALEAANREAVDRLRRLDHEASAAAALSRRLCASPYMHDGDRFCYTDAHGKRVMGFCTPRLDEGELYPGFENIFRGSESFVRDRLRVYLPILRRHERVVEIGCGRGELLDLLSEAGVPAVGVDIDEAMVRRCRAKGHVVERMDGIGYLRQQRDGCVPAIVATHVIEHLSFEDLIAFFELSVAKLRPGGELIFETVNPHALEAFKSFWTDVTHQRPIFPEVALAWCWLVGFDHAHVVFPNGVGELEQDRVTQGEYAIIATKGVASPPMR